MNFKLINLEFWPRRLYLTTGVAQINQNLSHKLISRVRQRLTLTIHYKLRSGDNQIEKQSVESNESVDRSITLASIDSFIGRQLAQVDFPFFLFFQVSQVHWRRQVQAFRLSTEKAEQKAGKKNNGHCPAERRFGRNWSVQLMKPISPPCVWAEESFNCSASRFIISVRWSM